MDELGEVPGDFGEANVFCGIAQPVDHFDLSFGKFLADVDPERDAGQVGVLEFDAGALVAVVEQGIKAGAVEVGGECFTCCEKVGFADVGDGDDDVEGGDGRRERVGLARVFCGGGFDSGGEDTFYADAVRAHDGCGFLAVAIEDGGAHGLRVLVTELEDVADFDGFAEA